MQQINNEYETKQMNEIAVNQRIGDGYIYIRTDETTAFIEALSADTLQGASELIQVVKGGVPELQGTWVHPYVAINLAQ